MQTIYEHFIQTAEIMQGKTLFERPGKPDLSYIHTRELVERLAAALTERGVTPGDRVAAQIEKSPEAIALYLATLQVGGIFLPLNPAYTGAEIDYFIGDAAPRLFVCDPAQVSAHAHRAGAALAVETLGAQGDGTLTELSARLTPREEYHPAGALLRKSVRGIHLVNPAW